MNPGPVENIKSFYRDNSRSLSIADHDYSFIEMGEGEPVIFLHGLVGTKSVWRSCMKGLSGRYNVISLDVPGIHIFKQLPSKRAVYPDLAHWLNLFLDHKGISSFHLVGHSVSALFGLYYASKEQSRIRSLNLVSLPQWYESENMPEPTIWNLLSKIERSPQPFEEYMGYLVNDKTLSPKYFRSIQEKAFRLFKPRVKSILKQLKQSAIQINARTATIQVPVQLIYGAQDRFLTQDLVNDLDIMLPGITAHTLDNCCHLPHIEKKEETIDLLKSFLRDQSNASIK